VEEAMQGLNAMIPSNRYRAIRSAARKAVALVLLAGGLAGCGAVDALLDGLKHAKAVETELAGSAGMRPTVGFNWNNGRLTTVTVTFPKLLDDKPLKELSEIVRGAVAREFKQRADNVVLAFSLGPTTTTTADANPARNMN
jgi:hypothetical protein